MPRPSAARWKWPSMPPLWPTKATPASSPAEAQRLARVQHVQHHAVDVVGDAEAIRADDGEPGRRARSSATSSCVSLSPTSAKPAANTIAEPTLRLRAGLDRVAHARGRQREHGKVDALRQFLRALQHRPAVDRLVAAADQMDVALEVVELERLQDDLAGAAGARRNADDRHRSRAQELGDGLRAACGFRTGHFASLSGCHISRCSPLSSGCQYGFTFMPTFSSSAVQLTMSAMTLTPSSSVTLAMA